MAKSKQVFRNFTALPNDNHYLNSGIIYAFWIDKEGKIWIGTEDGGVNIFNPKTGLYEYLVSEEGNNNLPQNCIKAFTDDMNGNLWIGTFLGGIKVINLATKKTKHYYHSPSDPQSISDNRI